LLNYVHRSNEDKAMDMQTTTTSQPRRPLPCAVTDRRMAGGHEVIGNTGAGASRVAPMPADVTRNLIREVAEQYGVPSHLLYAPTKVSTVVKARWAAIRRLREEHHMSSTQIGNVFCIDHTSVLYALGRVKHRRPTAQERMARASLRKMSARDFIDSPPQLALLLNGARVNLADGDIIGRLQHLRLCEANRVPHERRRDPTARRVPAEQRIDDIDAAILAARFVRRFGHGH
jgi:hypothetical protein